MKYLKIAGKKLAHEMNRCWKDESGMGTVEVILIIVVLIGLVIVFKQQIGGLVENIFKTIKEDSNAVTG